MKPIIEDMKDMTDSTEIYNSRPNPAITYFIYLICFIMVISFGWMYILDIDIVVKANGIFRYEEDSADISSSVSGKVESCTMEEGQYVNAGDTLLTIEVDSISESIQEKEYVLAEINQRIEMLEAYRVWLDGEGEAFETLTDNIYYDEFSNRKSLLEISMSSSGKNIDGQKTEYKKSLENLEKSKEQYEKQIEKLNYAKQCIKTRRNMFSDEDVYYKSLVENYISNYAVTTLQYENKRKEYQDNLQETQEGKMYISEQSVDRQSDREIEIIYNKIEMLNKEENQALLALELQQLTEIEQQIESVNNSLLSIESNITSVNIQLKTLEKTDAKTENSISVMTEKNTVDSELVTYKEKKNEYEHSLKNLNIQNGKCTIKAETSGYVYMNTDVKQGMYIQEGTSVAQILPEKDCGHYAEIYVENNDIAKLKEGQKVKFEIPAYPSSEYGYFTGVIEVISKDIKADTQSGSAYYLVKVRCDKETITDSKGNKGSIINGMACQAKVVTDKKSVLSYVLEKIDLMD